MAFAAILPGDYNPEWDATLGRRGHQKHGHAPDFDPLDLGNDLLLWFDTTTLTTGAITSWTDRKGNKGLIPGGSGTISFDGAMVAITNTAFLFGNATWDASAPFEIWQVVDQTEAAGSANATSLAFGAGPSALELLYTPAIGGQSSATVNGQSLFGADDYHGVHVTRWQIANGSQLGWMDRKPGVPASLGYSNPLEPASWYVGANAQGANLWKGRIGDTVATKPLSSGEVNAMWDFMSNRITSPPPRAFNVDAASDAQSGDTGFYRTVYGSVSQEPLVGEELLEFATRNTGYFQVAWNGDVLGKVRGWKPVVAGIDIGTLSSDWSFNGTNTSATWIGGGMMISTQQYAVTWERM